MFWPLQGKRQLKSGLRHFVVGKKLFLDFLGLEGGVAGIGCIGDFAASRKSGSDKKKEVSKLKIIDISLYRKYGVLRVV